MNQAIADSICTAVTLGFIAREVSHLSDYQSKQVSRINGVLNRYESSSATLIQYENEVDKSKYDQVQSLFHGLGVDFNISPSMPQKNMPYVAGKTNKFYSVDMIEGQMKDHWLYRYRSEQKVQEFGYAPYGAYIGGLHKPSKDIIYGPSRLETYEPQFRKVDDSLPKDAYDKAKRARDQALECIRDVYTRWNIPKGVSTDISNLPTVSPSEPSLPSKHVFKSYHGMIQAMMANRIIGDDDFCFEIALGPETTKVSSCMPCCLFMTSLNMPPTSTHLGRGDNWNIPGVNTNNLKTEARTKAWYENVLVYYGIGKNILNTNSNSLVASMISFLDGKLDNLPLIFLEALTFENSFTTRIIKTLSRQ